jgi:hypothetical protein
MKLKIVVVGIHRKDDISDDCISMFSSLKEKRFSRNHTKHTSRRELNLENLLPTKDKTTEKDKNANHVNEA